MGVIRKLRNKVAVVSLSHESVNSLGISQPSTQPPTPPTEPATPTGTPTSPEHAAPQRRMPSLLIERLENHRPRAGARRTRRANNTKALQTLIEDDFEETGEPSIADFQPKTESAFTRLLNDCNNMRVWQYFISRNEADQMAYLESISPKHHKSDGPGSGVSFSQARSQPKDDEEVEEENMPEEDGFVMVPRFCDCREVHPACTPEQLFNKISPQMRIALMNKHLPLGIVSYLEEEVVSAFSKDPSSIYISSELSSYERLLLHGLCQYNRLKSKSMTIARIRRTKVSNKGKCFHAPKVSLTEFLKKNITQ